MIKPAQSENSLNSLKKGRRAKTPLDNEEGREAQGTNEYGEDHASVYKPLNAIIGATTRQ